MPHYKDLPQTPFQREVAESMRNLYEGRDIPATHPEDTALSKIADGPRFWIVTVLSTRGGAVQVDLGTVVALTEDEAKAIVLPRYIRPGSLLQAVSASTIARKDLQDALSKIVA